MTQYLALSISSFGSASDFAEIYRSIREQFVIESLKEIHKSAKDQEQSFSMKTIRYDRGTTILIEYYRRLAWIMKNERRLIERFFSPVYSALIYGSIFTKSIDMFLELAESACGRTRKSLQKKEFGDIAIILDIWNGIHKFTDPETMKVNFVI